jgi:hypothetical protein
LRFAGGEAAVALRDRRTLYGVAAEFNAERDLAPYERCRAALLTRFDDAVWPDQQEQLLHRLPLDADDARSVLVLTRSGVAGAADASDLIARLSGRAYWRKLFVRKDRADLAEARAICMEVLGGGKHEEALPRSLG